MQDKRLSYLCLHDLITPVISQKRHALLFTQLFFQFPVAPSLLARNVLFFSTMFRNDSAVLHQNEEKNFTATQRKTRN